MKVIFAIIEKLCFYCTSCLHIDKQIYVLFLYLIHLKSYLLRYIKHIVKLRQVRRV